MKVLSLGAFENRGDGDPVCLPSDLLISHPHLKLSFLCRENPLKRCGEPGHVLAIHRLRSSYNLLKRFDLLCREYYVPQYSILASEISSNLGAAVDHKLEATRRLNALRAVFISLRTLTVWHATL
jgi:hypothetical protein